MVNLLIELLDTIIELTRNRHIFITLQIDDFPLYSRRDINAYVREHDWERARIQLAGSPPGEAFRVVWERAGFVLNAEKCVAISWKRDSELLQQIDIDWKHVELDISKPRIRPALYHSMGGLHTRNHLFFPLYLWTENRVQKYLDKLSYISMHVHVKSARGLHMAPREIKHCLDWRSVLDDCRGVFMDNVKIIFRVRINQPVDIDYESFYLCGPKKSHYWFYDTPSHVAVLFSTYFLQTEPSVGIPAT